MPRKSTKVVDESVAVANDGCSATNTSNKKLPPVKRSNKKTDSLTTPTIASTASTGGETASPLIKTNDSVNTFNIHINHISEDGNNIENTFSTTYTHTGENGNSKEGRNTSSGSGSGSGRDSSISSDESDSEGYSDYDKRFTNSSLALPIAANSITTDLLGSGLFEDAHPLYTTQQINYDILIPFVLINMHASSRENIMALLHTTLISCIEGRCITEGFIKPHSTRIIDFKCGKIIAKNVQFNIVIQCLVCNPQPQSIITCVAKNITQAGIRAVSDDEYSPIVVYITRDFGIESDKTYYSSIKEGDKINIRVIGKRFEMNDKHIQIIGFLVQPKKERIAIVTLSHPKKSSLSNSIQTSGASATTIIETKQESTTSTKRGPKKSKNPLSIVNDTSNNVITITYDSNIELPKERKTRVPKAPNKTKKESDSSSNTNTNIE